MHGEITGKKVSRYPWILILCIFLFFTGCAMRDMRGLWQFRQVLGDDVTEMRLSFYGYYRSGGIQSEDGNIEGEYYFSYNHDLTIILYWPSDQQGWYHQAVYSGGFDGSDEMSGTLDYHIALSGGEVIKGTWSAIRLTESIN